VFINVNNVDLGSNRAKHNVAAADVTRQASTKRLLGTAPKDLGRGGVNKQLSLQEGTQMQNKPVFGSEYSLKNFQGLPDP
jgi:hypothetical protein